MDARRQQPVAPAPQPQVKRPDASQFRPERFLCDTSTEARPDYVPSGLGPRLCIGREFALAELAILLAVAVRTGQGDAAEPNRL